MLAKVRWLSGINLAERLGRCLILFSYSQGKSAELGKLLVTRTFVLLQEPVHRWDKAPGSRQ